MLQHEQRMICYYLMGWADKETLTAPILKLQKHDAEKIASPVPRGTIEPRVRGSQRCALLGQVLRRLRSSMTGARRSGARRWR